MNKPLLVFQGPVFTRSGYGDHCRDLLKSLYKMDKYDIKIIPLRWGNTPQNQVDPSTEFGQTMLNSVIGQIAQKPDIFIQVSVANEFEAKGHYNIGVTAGVETTICPKNFIDGSNNMDLILVPSEFTKRVLATTTYQHKNQQTGDIVGHWLRGDLGQDRKDIGMAIKTFATVFQYLPKEKRPGLIVKTSHAGFSVIDREATREKIERVVQSFGDKCPSIYLVHGDLEEADMAHLYHHPKVKAMVSFAKGEGYGRPLAEFTLTGKPIVASGWSGQVDFLPAQHSVLLEGELTPVHESAADDFIMKEAQWFTVNYNMAANKLYDIYNNYDIYVKQSAGLKQNSLNKFTLDKMHEVFTQIMEKNVKAAPKVVPFNLPKLNKLPTLNKA